MSVAVKDVIDVAGFKTTGGCELVSARAVAAQRDADCVWALKGAGFEVVGKTNCNELAFGTDGWNSWSGTPQNPLGNGLVPGGSSSGNAVALALGYCSVAIGTDTGGSVRIPAACCGVAGLKTTYGRISRVGALALAQSLDTIGPMARTVEGLRHAYSALTGLHAYKRVGKITVYRIRYSEVDAAIECAIDGALSAAGLRVTRSSISEDAWEAAIAATNFILWTEAVSSFEHLREDWKHLQIGKQLSIADTISKDFSRVARARSFARSWRKLLSSEISKSSILVSPTIPCLTPSFFDVSTQGIRLARFTSPVNLAGLPAISIPLPRADGLPASIQLIGPEDGEHLLLSMAERIEAATKSSHWERAEEGHEDEGPI